MANALVCDECETSLPLNARGEHEDGEDSGWIVLHLANERFDLCTRSCVHAFIDRPGVIAAHDGWLEAITGISRTIHGDDDGPPADRDEGSDT